MNNNIFDVDAELVERFGIDKNYEPNAIEREAYVNEQISQMKKIVWRQRVDIMLLTAANAETDAEKDEQQSKLKTAKRELGKFVDALKTLNEIKDGLV